MASRVNRLDELSGPGVGRSLSSESVIVLPLGAVEQHGPHLPLNTDYVVAESVSREVVARVGSECDTWLLPTLPFTKSNEHAWAAGTMWLSASTLMAVLDDIGRSIAATPARRLLFINGHGGNSSLVAMANRELRLKHGLMTFLAHPHVPADQGGSSGAGELGMGVHGGMDETSMMLHLRPDLVDMTLARRSVPDRLAENTHVRFGGSVSFGWLSNDFAPDGVIGDPTGATPEAGAAMFETSVGVLCDVVREVSRFDFGR